MRAFLLPVFICFIFLSCEEETVEEADLYSAVPQSSIIILESGNFINALNNLGKTNIYLNADSIPAISRFENKLKEISALFAPDSLRKFFENRRVLMSLSPSGASKYDVLFTCAGSPDFNKSAFDKLSKAYTFKSKAYADNQIITFYKNEEEFFSFSTHNNILLISENITLVEESIRQLNSDFNFRNNEEFARLHRTANKKDLANIYLNLQELPLWLDKAMPLAENSFMSRMGNWAELDLQLYNNELLMSGLILLPENEPTYLNSFTNSDAQKSMAATIIPSNAGLWVSHTFENAEEYLRSYEDYLNSSGTLQRHSQQIEEYPQNLRENLLHWIDTEMGYFLTSSSEEKIAYLKYRDEDAAVKGLKILSDSSFIEGYRGYILERFKDDDALSHLFGRLFKEIEKPYYIILEDYVILSDDPTLLKGVVNELIAGKTLNSNESYQKFAEQITDEAHINVLVSNPAFLDIWAGYLSGNTGKALKNNKNSLKNFRWAGAQINVKDDVAYINFLMLNETVVEEEVIREWSTVLESPAAMAPQLLLNHTTSHYDVFVQDKNHKIYLIDKDGKLLWSKQLDGPILGGIKQVDAFKNNKLQMVCNTAGTLYLIDRLGRDVENFPVKLPQNATAQAGIFNYDLARNYRVVIPAGTNLLNYSLDGKAVKGWKFKKVKSNLISQPQLFTINNKDVIVVLDESGELHLLNRRGDERFKSIPELKDVIPPFYLRVGDKLKESELLANTSDGKVAVIGFTGVVDKLYLEEGKPAEQFLYFDGKYIFSKDEELIVKSDDKPWRAEVQSEISEKPKAMVLRSEFYVAAYSENAENIFLFNRNGELIKGFPVYAQGSFDMGSLRQDGVINIITSSEDGTVLCYKVR